MSGAQAAFSIGSNSEGFRAGAQQGILRKAQVEANRNKDVLFFKCQHLLTTISHAIRSFHTVPSTFYHVLSHTQFQAPDI